MANSISVLNHAADNIRILAAAAVEKAKSGHPGGAMGGADFINVLYSEFLEYDPENPSWAGRDRFFLDPGHMSPMLYSQLCLIGKFSLEDLQQLRQWGSVCPGHPEVDIERGIENTSGPLGQGHTFAVGAAIAAKFLAAKTGNPIFANEKIYAYISDGGIEEEISQGSGRIAGHLGLNNLIMFYDSNDIQLSTECAEVMTEDTAAKYKAWNWNVIEINGNDAQAIRDAITAAKAEKDRPTLIIGKCIMGKGAVKADGSSYERNCKTHGAPLGGDAFKNTIVNLGGDPENPFQIFDDVKELYANRAEELKDIMAKKYAEEKAWADANPDKAAELKKWFANEAPVVDWAGIAQKENDATRSASATVLSALAEQVENMVCSSADLSNSDKTDGFLKKTHAFLKGDFSGAFFQAGVAELTMACCCIGMSLHGGVIPACGTFFVFSDYMKPAVRMAALMQLPVKFIWTHDAFRVGEDGPTHEPVEQLIGLRAIPNCNVIRPADARETVEAFKIAYKSTETPTVIILSRQNLTVRNTNSDLVNKGAYIVKDCEKPDYILLATGSEVSLAYEVSKLIKNVKVVSMPSEFLFNQQSEEYKKSILNDKEKTIAIEMGTTLGWYKYANNVIGIDTFGLSAPAKVLAQHFGFTAEEIVKKIQSFK